MATKSKRTASKTKNESTSEEDDLLMTEEPEVTVSIEDLLGRARDGRKAARGRL